MIFIARWIKEYHILYWYQASKKEIFRIKEGACHVNYLRWNHCPSRLDCAGSSSVRKLKARWNLKISDNLMIMMNIHTIINMNVKLAYHLFRIIKRWKIRLTNWLRIQRIQVRKYSKLQDKYTTCSICLCDFDDGYKVRELACGHRMIDFLF